MSKTNFIGKKIHIIDFPCKSLELAEFYYDVFNIWDDDISIHFSEVECTKEIKYKVYKSSCKIYITDDYSCQYGKNVSNYLPEKLRKYLISKEEYEKIRAEWLDFRREKNQ